MKLSLKSAIFFVALFLYVLLRPSAWPWLVLLAGVLLLSWQSVRNLPRLKIVRALSGRRAFPGAIVEVNAEVSVHAPWPIFISTEENVPHHLIANKRVGASLLVWGNESIQFHYTVQPNKRGGYNWPALSVSYSDVFGLFNHNIRIETAEKTTQPELLVFPHSHALLLPSLLRTFLSDGPISRMQGIEDPSSFASLRSYTPTDPMRRIHWKHTARFGTSKTGAYNQLMVRVPERVAATGVLLYLDLNVSGRMAEIFLESAVRLAASILRVASEQGLAVGVSSNSQTGQVVGGEHGLLLALEQLALMKCKANIFLSSELPPAGTNVVIISMNAPTLVVEMAAKLRARAAQVFLLAMPEGFYLEPGETARPLFSGPPNSVRELMAKAGVLAGLGVQTIVLRGNDKVMEFAKA